MLFRFIFLVFALTRAGLLWWDYQHTLAAEQRRAEDLAHVLAEHLNRTFGAIESAVNQLAVHSAGVGGPGAHRQAWSEVLAATLSGLQGAGSHNATAAACFVVASATPSLAATAPRRTFLPPPPADA